MEWIRHDLHFKNRQILPQLPSVMGIEGAHRPMPPQPPGNEALLTGWPLVGNEGMKLYMVIMGIHSLIPY